MVKREQFDKYTNAIVESLMYQFMRDRLIYGHDIACDRLDSRLLEMSADIEPGYARDLFERYKQ